MRLLRGPDHPGSAAEVAGHLAAAADTERAAVRLRRRDEAADFRRLSRRTQAIVRLADSGAKLGGGSLLTATLLLLLNGQVNWPVAVIAVSALLVFVVSTMFLVYLDRQIAEFDHSVDVIEAALKETER